MACDSRRPTGNTYRDVRIHHNVFTGTRASALWLQDVPGGQARPRGNVARNNIVLRGADGATFDIGDPGRWSSLTTPFPMGSRAGSPAVAAGKRVREVGSDLWNTPRRARPSIGVHERLGAVPRTTLEFLDR